MERPVEATTLAGFIQQLAVQYIGRGYYFFVTGTIKPHKDPALVDAKLCERYSVALSKWAKARRRAAGLASHAYIRFEQFFVLLSTQGQTPFFEDEGEGVRDARKTPVRFRGYAVSFRGGHVHVRIDRPRYLELKSYLVGIATHRTADELAAEFRRSLAFEPYAPVRSQCLCILRAANRVRAEAGLEDVPRTCLRFRRRVVKPFGLVTHDTTRGAGSP